MYHLSKRSRKALKGVHPMLAFAVYEAIRITEQDFMVLEGVRSVEKQAEYVANGTSKTMDSYHLYGLAVDLVAYDNGTLSWDEHLYDAIATAMKIVCEKHSLDIDWGYDLWNWDMAHFQMTGYKERYDIRRL